MKNQLGIIILILLCVGLIVALVVNQKKATELHSQDTLTILDKSNQLVQTTSDLEEARTVNTDLNKMLDTRKSELLTMTNQLNDVAGNLAKTEDMLKTPRSSAPRKSPSAMPRLLRSNHKIWRWISARWTSITPSRT